MSPISATRPTAVSVSIPRRQREAADRWRPRPLGGLLEDQGVPQPLASGEQHLVVGQVLAEDDLKEWLLETSLASHCR